MNASVAGVVAKGFSNRKRSDDPYAGIYEIGTIPRGDCEAMNGSGRRDEAIFNRHRFTACLKPREHVKPTVSTKCQIVGHAPPNEGAIDWLLSCPQKGFFVPVESESTDTL